MATDSTIKPFTAADIERYHRGLLSPAERHALEKAALDDPFLADALEGYSAAGLNPGADLAELKTRLSGRISTSAPVAAGKSGRVISFPWFRAAAMVVILGGGAWLTYKVAFETKDKGIAKTDNREVVANNDSISSPGTLTITDTSATVTGNTTPLYYTDSAAPVKDRPATTATIPGAKQDAAVTSPPAAAESESTRGITIADSISIVNARPVQQLPAASDKTLDDKKVLANASRSKKEQDASTFAERSDTLKQDKNARLQNEYLKGMTGNNDAAFRKGKLENQKVYEPVNRFRGRVTDANDNGIPFANVSNVQDNVGTYTDAKGYFNLTSTADSTLDVNVRALGFNINNTRLRQSLPYNQVIMQEDQSIAPQTLTSQKVNYEQRRSRDASMKLEGEPEPEDGWDNYDSYLTNNINGDLKTKQNASGQVEISFEVNKAGEPVNIKVEKSLCARCDQEAIRLVKEGPKWKRKARKGRTRVTISF